MQSFQLDPCCMNSYYFMVRIHLIVSHNFALLLYTSKRIIAIAFGFIYQYIASVKGKVSKVWQYSAKLYCAQLLNASHV